MEESKVDLFIATNRKYFPVEKLGYLRQKLLDADDSKHIAIASLEYKDPTVALIVSLLLGNLGIDRFIIGDIGMGVLKLLTLGVCGILTIVDWFTVSKRAKEKNFNEIMLIL